MTIENPLARYTYANGELIQACPECDWAQAGHHKELVNCPACDAPLGDDVAIQFGGLLVVRTGSDFDVYSRTGGCVQIEAADYPDVLAFMCRHGTDYRREESLYPSRVRRVLKRRAFAATCQDVWEEKDGTVKP